MKLKLFYEGDTKTVSSERAAKTWAREQLGAKQLKETPTANARRRHVRERGHRRGAWELTG